MVSSPSSSRLSLSLASVAEDSDSVFSPSLATAVPVPTDAPFDVAAHYSSLLLSDAHLSMPIAAIETLAEVISRSPSTSTTTELFTLLSSASQTLAQSSFNPISLSCGTALFLRFLTLQRPSSEMSFNEFKTELVARAREFVNGVGKCRELIAEYCQEFILNDSIILVHSYSRVVIQALLHAHAMKKRFKVYVTEARPYGLGIKTDAILRSNGIESRVILDSSVAFIMGKVDAVFVGSEGVCESGGVVNFIGSYQMAITAKAIGKPLYGGLLFLSYELFDPVPDFKYTPTVLAESYKFTRMFPLSQYDLPSSLPVAPLSFSPLSPSTTTTSNSSTPFPTTSTEIPPTPSRPMINSPAPIPLQMTDEMTQQNPTLDYTTPNLITLVITDLGAMTPSGISDALLGIYGGE